MSLTIKDLSKELDQASLTAVRGGDNGNSATNSIVQLMGISVPVAESAGGPANTNITVKGVQNASNWNLQYGGDSYLALLPFAV